MCPNITQVNYCPRLISEHYSLEIWDRKATDHLQGSVDVHSNQVDSMQPTLTIASDGINETICDMDAELAMIVVIC